MIYLGVLAVGLAQWLCAAVLALVVLRNGALEGTYRLAWVVLPAGLLLAVFGATGPLIMMLGAAALALVLRALMGWQPVLLAAVLLGAVTGWLLLWFAEPYLQQLVEELEKFFAGLQGDLPEGQQLQAPGIVALAGLLGLMYTVTCLLSVLLARYWQAALFNPGGFKQEFHALRLSPQVAVALLAAMLGVGLYGFEYRPWAVLLVLPLSVAGIAFLHARAAHRGLGAGWLTVFYLFWLVLDPVRLIVIGVAVADSLMDFRRRWQSQGGSED